MHAWMDGWIDEFVSEQINDGMNKTSASGQLPSSMTQSPALFPPNLLGNKTFHPQIKGV